MTTEYEDQAKAFAENYNVTMTTVYKGHYPRWSEAAVSQWFITLSRPGREPWRFDFSSSINDSWKYREDGSLRFKSGLPWGFGTRYQLLEIGRDSIHFKDYWIAQAKVPPTLYDVLSCITKYDPGTFNEFCSEFGYNNDSLKDFATYQDVCKEYENVYRLFSDCLDELQEIC